jgi:hypothetical protein
VALVASALVGCPSGTPSGPTLRAADLPADPRALAALADELYARGDPTSLENALFALEHGRASHPDDVELAWRAARVCAFMADDPDASRARKSRLAGRGVDHARAALARAPDLVAGHYYLAINLGLRAQALAAAGGVGGLATVPAVAAAARKVVALDPAYDHGGGYRVLGMLLVRAPPAPASIGDIALGLDNLALAVKRDPTFPLNHLLYAEGLIEAGEYERARAEIDTVMAAPPAGEWARIGARWRARARELLDDLARLTGGAGSGDGDGDGDGEVPR